MEENDEYQRQLKNAHQKIAFLEEQIKNKKKELSTLEGEKSYWVYVARDLVEVMTRKDVTG